MNKRKQIMGAVAGKNTSCSSLDHSYNPKNEYLLGHISGGVDRDGKAFITIYGGLDPDGLSFQDIIVGLTVVKRQCTRSLRSR